MFKSSIFVSRACKADIPLAQAERPHRHIKLQTVFPGKLPCSFAVTVLDQADLPDMNAR
jgi:hypothetical protein